MSSCTGVGVAQVVGGKGSEGMAVGSWEGTGGGHICDCKICPPVRLPVPSLGATFAAAAQPLGGSGTGVVARPGVLALGTSMAAKAVRPAIVFTARRIAVTAGSTGSVDSFSQGLFECVRDGGHNFSGAVVPFGCWGGRDVQNTGGSFADARGKTLAWLLGSTPRDIWDGWVSRDIVVCLWVLPNGFNGGDCINAGNGGDTMEVFEGPGGQCCWWLLQRCGW